MRSWSDTFDMSSIPDAVLKSEWARRTSAKRVTFGAGPGRPRKPRCKCGKMTQDAAAKTGHVC